MAVDHAAMVRSGLHECAADCPLPAADRALRIIDGTTPPPARQPAESFADVQAYIDHQLECIESDLGDGETMQHLGIHGTARLQEKRATLLDIQWLIRGAVAAEAADRQQAAADDSVEQQYRDAYGPDPIAPWQAEGR
ncbi:MAG TPA: hypothetical protein VEW95_05405 [Candidatus Limnocylindrales bacterium]|nr:hypothetical protein [Candidatus Limnocylindrales bacterium]